MATRSKSSGGKSRRTGAGARARSGRKAPPTSGAGGKRRSTSKASGRASAAKPAASRRSRSKQAGSKRKGTTGGRKQSPVTRIKRVTTAVLHQGAAAAKQGVEAVERLVEEVKDRVTP